MFSSRVFRAVTHTPLWNNSCRSVNTTIPHTIPMASEVTLEEVKKHNTKKDCWLVINGKVFDVSGFHNRHPGEGINDEYIAHHAGRDVSELFEKYHYTDEPFEWLLDAEKGKMPEIKYIGVIKK